MALKYCTCAPKQACWNTDTDPGGPSPGGPGELVSGATVQTLPSTRTGHQDAVTFTTINPILSLRLNPSILSHLGSLLVSLRSRQQGWLLRGSAMFGRIVCSSLMPSAFQSQPQKGKRGPMRIFLSVVHVLLRSIVETCLPDAPGWSERPLSLWKRKAASHRV